jgi:hypothetical protein
MLDKKGGWLLRGFQDSGMYGAGSEHPYNYRRLAPDRRFLQLSERPHRFNAQPNKSRRGQSLHRIAQQAEKNERGVSLDRAAPAGYVGLTAIASDGMLVAHVLRRIEVGNNTERREAAIETLWQMIEDYEAATSLRSGRSPLPVTAHPLRPTLMR